MFIFGFIDFWIYALLVLIQSPNFAAGADTGAPVRPPGTQGEWTGWGGNIYNNRWNSENSQINSSSVGLLTQNCKLDYKHGVSATPVVLNYTVYYPTINGSFVALDYATCEQKWHINVTQLIYDFKVPDKLVETYSLAIARTSPQINGGVLYFGTQMYALLIAVEIETGDHIATTQVNDHPLAVVTISPTFYDGKIFVGASSHEDGASADTTYKCCSFIGNAAAFSLDFEKKKFTKVWDVPMLPDGWAGAGVWGSQPSIDPVRNQVFFGTGNLLQYPPAYEKCINATAACLPSGVFQDSILALDVKTGKINWHQTITPLDSWVLACGYPGAPTSESSYCPQGVGPDADFGMAPTFVPAALGDGTTGNDSVVVGQKSGNVYNFNAATGDIQWNIATAADNSGNWLSWGVAVDAQKIYFTGINYGGKNWTLKTSGAKINNSAWGAINLKTGTPMWETQVPLGQLAYTPPGLVNDLIFVGQSGSSTLKIDGAVVALNKDTGAIVNTLPIQSVQDGGIIAKDGFIMFGTGYAYRNPFEAGSFYVFALPGAVDEAKLGMEALAKPSKISSSLDGVNKSDPTNALTGVAAPSASKKSLAVDACRGAVQSAIYPLVLLAIFSVCLG